VRISPALLAALAVAAMPAGARAAQRPVYVVPGASPAVLERFPDRAALGLLVPDAGPTTSEARARRSLARGKVVNSLSGERASGPRLLGFVVVRGILGRVERGTILGIPQGAQQANDRRYPLMELGRRGVVTSTSTRVPGLVSIADLAHPERLSLRREDDPVGYLRDLERRIRDNGRSRVVAAVAVAVVVALLAFVAPVAGVLAFAAVAAMNLLLGVAGVSEPWMVVTLLLLAALVALPLALLLRGPVAIGLALASVIAGYLVAMGVDATWVALSPLGPSQNGRFYGVSNLLETMLLVPALAAAALLFRRFGWAAFAGVAALALVTVAGSRFGADGGGAIVLAAGYGVLGAMYAGGGRRALVVAAGAAAAAVAVVALDAVFGPTTHVGEAVRGGPGEVLGDVGDRLVLSWRRATDNAFVGLVVAGSIAALVFLVVRGPRRALPLAFAAAIAVSLLVNDSPREVALGGLVGYLALLRFDDRQAEPGVYTWRNPLKELSRNEAQGLRS